MDDDDLAADMAMTTEATAQLAAVDEGARREQSTIVFPYHDLDAGIEVATAAYNRCGQSPCDLDELAAEMGQVISGAFRVKLATARIFNLVEKDGRSAVKLSELGRRIITGDAAASAKADAFLSVPLYAKLFDAYKGQKLPPMKALEREMANLGVSAKQTDKARQAFERSAKQAGFFDAGTDRLVRPRGDAIPTPRDATKREHEPDHDSRAPVVERRREGGSAAMGGAGKDHPLIHGLLVTLPEPGTAWTQQQRSAWLQMAESIFNMIYPKPPATADEAARSPGNVRDYDDLLG